MNAGRHRESLKEGELYFREEYRICAGGRVVFRLREELLRLWIKFPPSRERSEDHGPLHKGSRARLGLVHEIFGPPLDSHGTR